VARHLSILLAVASLAFFAGLGRAAITDSDEAFYAEAAREMVTSGDWTTPRYNFEDRFQKPVLYYWLAALAYEAAGVTAAAARAPAALAGLGTVLLTWACGRRWLGPRPGLLAGLIVATCFGSVSLARLALPDMPLACFVTLAAWAGLEAWPAAGTDRHAGWWLVLAAIAAAAAFLTKGPVGLALPALVVLAWVAVRWTTAGRRPWDGPGRLHAGLAVVAFAAVAAPWYVAMADRHGLAYLHRFFIGENLERFATGRYNEPRSLFFYAPIVAGGLLPWTPLLAATVPALWARLRRVRPMSPTDWRLLLWAALPLLFYSVSVGKQPRYVLPALPPLALVMAAAVSARLARATPGAKHDRLLAWCATASAVALVLVALLLWRASPLVVAVAPVAGLAAIAVLAASGLALGIVAWRGRPHHVTRMVAGAAVAAWLSVHFAFYATPAADPVKQIAAAALADREPVAASGTYRALVRNLVFYTGRKQEDLPTEAALDAFVASPHRVHVVLAARHLARLEARLGRRFPRLADAPYFNPAGVRLGTLLHPDPPRAFDRVVLIANR